MKTMTLISLAAALALAGCGPKAPQRPTPLTVEQWKTLPVARKYDPETLERLKEADPTLQTHEGWLAFQRTLVLPSRKKDFPGKRV